MDKHNNLATLNKRKINYFKILAWIGFVFSIFLFLKIKPMIIRVNYGIEHSFPNINSEEPLIVLSSIILFVGVISLLIILLTNNISHKIINISNKRYNISKEKISSNNKNINELHTFKSINTKNIKILAFISFLLSAILLLVIYKYYFLHVAATSDLHVGYNYTGILLAIIIAYIGTVSCIFLWILWHIINTTKLTENNLIVFTGDIEKIKCNSHKNYIKIFAWCILILSIFFFIYLTKEYLSQENFKYWQGAYYDINKINVFMLLFSIIYIGTICFLASLILGTVHCKIKTIKESISNLCYEQDKPIKKATINKLSIFKRIIIRIIAVCNLGISIYFVLYLNKYFNKQFVLLIENTLK